MCQPGESATGACLPAVQDHGLEVGGGYRSGTRYQSGLRHFWWEG
jgi:hypothetical protein